MSRCSAREGTLGTQGAKQQHQDRGTGWGPAHPSTSCSPRTGRGPAISLPAWMLRTNFPPALDSPRLQVLEAAGCYTALPHLQAGSACALGTSVPVLLYVSLLPHTGAMQKKPPTPCGD